MRHHSHRCTCKREFANGNGKMQMQLANWKIGFQFAGEGMEFKLANAPAIRLAAGQRQIVCGVVLARCDCGL